MKKVLVMLAQGFEEIEAVTVVDVLRRANIVCDMCSIDKEYVKGVHNISVKSDCNIDDIDPLEYDAIVLPGGLPGATNLRDERVGDFVKQLNENGKIVAAICAAPEILEGFGVLKNKKCTSYPGFVKNRDGVTYIEDITVVDGNIITSRGPATSIMFALTIMKQLGYAKEAHDIKEGMMVNFYDKIVK
ncbi:DJ-1 family glyoxalase III [Romboutsia sp.]|uniref:DJ-1 family glyoxalase III n=1 Tax=Romboutsia sp. TaxID=1965302 RepID=UPI003F403FC9